MQEYLFLVLIIMAATLTADVLFGFLIIYLVFYVKKPSFDFSNGVIITVGKKDLYNVESFICSRLWVTKRERNYKYSNKSIIYLLLLLCGDIGTCSGPTQTSTGLQDFLTAKGFSVLHQSIREMEGKKDLVADFLFNNKVNIFSLSETFLSHKNFTDVEIGVTVLSTKTINRSTETLECISESVFCTQEGFGM